VLVGDQPAICDETNLVVRSSNEGFFRELEEKGAAALIGTMSSDLASSDLCAWPADAIGSPLVSNPHSLANAA
jgi:hypothetical protein